MCKEMFSCQQGVRQPWPFLFLLSVFFGKNRCLDCNQALNRTLVFGTTLHQFPTGIAWTIVAVIVVLVHFGAISFQLYQSRVRIKEVFVAQRCVSGLQEHSAAQLDSADVAVGQLHRWWRLLQGVGDARYLTLIARFSHRSVLVIFCADCLRVSVLE